MIRRQRSNERWRTTNDILQRSIEASIVLQDGSGGFDRFSEGKSAPLDFESLGLYGRDLELHLCDWAAERVKEGRMEVILTHGPSGCGKTKLIETIMKRLRNHQYVVAKGKFDRLRETAQPYSAIGEAFSQLCERIDVLKKERGPTIERIHEAIGDAVHLLEEIIPSLRKLLPSSDTASSPPSDGDFNEESRSAINDQSFNQIKHLLCKFLRVVASREHPVVLFLDDAQWADEASLEILTHLATDNEAEHILIIGAYRDQLGDLDELHAESLRIISRCHNQHSTLTEISLGAIDLEGVNDLVAGLLSLSTVATHQLAELVYRRTKGLCFFVIQFMALLQDDGLLTFSIKEGRWVWDLVVIDQQTKVCDNVADLVVGRIDDLDPLARSVLNAAGCLGNHIDAKMIARLLLLEENHRDVEQTESCARDQLDYLVDIGLLQAGSGDTYNFAHDRIQQAVHSFLHEGDQTRQKYHQQIGFELVKLFESSREARVLFSAVDQLNVGISEGDDYEVRIRVAELNLKAGTEAKRKSAFFPAAAYAQQGLTLLQGSTMWAEHFDLAEDLYILSAEMSLGCGNAEECRKAARALIAHSNSTVVKVRAYQILVHLLGETNCHDDAVSLGYKGLEVLGIRVSSTPGMRVVVVEILKTIRLVRRALRSNSFLTTPQATDEVVTAGMGLMEALLYNLYPTKTAAKTCPVVVCRMVQMSLEHGLCRETPMALGAFAGMIPFLGSFAEAYELGQLAQRLANEPFARCNFPTTAISLHVSLNHWGRPLRESIQPLNVAYREGMKMGAIRPGLACAMTSLHIQYASGTNLEPFHTDLQQLISLMDEFGLNNMSAVMTLLEELVRQLRGGRSVVPDLSVFSPENDRVAHDRRRLVFQRELTFILGDDEKGWMPLTEALGTSCPPTLQRDFLYVRETCFSALCYFQMSRIRHRSRRKYGAAARKCVRKVNKWFRTGTMNCHHWVHLLRAEARASRMRADIESVLQSYKRAIEVAVAGGWVHDRALFHERVGTFHLTKGNKSSAQRHLTQSMQLYMNWGAVAKAKSMEASYSFLTLVKSKQRTDRSVSLPLCHVSPKDTLNLRKLVF